MWSRTQRTAIVLSGQYRGCRPQNVHLTARPIDRLQQRSWQGRQYRSYHPDGSASPESRTASQNLAFNPLKGDREKLGHSNAAKSTRPGRADVHDGSASYVPFEHVKDDLSVTLSEAQTLTKSERHAFEQLRKIALNDGSKVDSASTSSSQQITLRPVYQQPVTSALDSLLDQMAYNDLRQQTNSHNVTSTLPDPHAEQPISPKALKGLRDKEQKRIQNLLNKAMTDVQVWHILDTDILAPIIALNLDNTLSGNEIHHNHPGEKPSRSHSLDVIGALLPDLLDLTAHTLRTRFPTSHLISAIPSLLRNAGPSAFALGASTELYNHVLAHSLDQNADLTAMLDTLHEMDQQVIAPNHETVNIVQRAMGLVHDVVRSKYGFAARLAWTTERQRSSVAGLKAWLDRVRFEDKEVLDDGDEEDEGQVV